MREAQPRSNDDKDKRSEKYTICEAMRNGPDDMRNGPDDMRNGPDNMRNGPDDMRNGPDDMRNSPDDMQNTPHSKSELTFFNISKII